MANVIGPDVSFYQDDPETPQGIDFVKMKASAGYVIIRAGQNLWPDTDFKVNWREAKLAGLPRGSYWFYDSRAEPKRQAELWIQQFGGDYGELPLCADFEEAYGGAYKGWRNWYTFLERIKQLVPGKEIVVYTAYYYWRENAPNATTQATNLKYFHQYPLWIAHYKAAEPLIPLPWTKDEWLFWQYTEGGDGKLYGVESGGIDLNYFNGDAAKFKARFNLSDVTPPPPDVDPNDPGTPTGKMYKVTASSLKVRTGPGLTYDSLGLLYLDEVVEEIGATADRAWLHVRRSDGGLTGWSFAAYLNLTGTTPPPDPDPDPDPDPGDIGTPTGKMYTVTATGLKVRLGPGLTFDAIGLLAQNEVVEEIGATSDRTWLRIRRPDGSMTGWSFAEYLQSADATPPPDPGTPPNTVPDDKDKKWYRVGVASLPVREAPNNGSKALGSLLLDDNIPALDDTSDPSWAQIRKYDGLIGWCEKKYLVYVSDERPISIRQNIFKGITYLRKELTSPRKLVMHVMAIDLQTIGLEFLATPSLRTDGIMCARTTSAFLSEFGVNVAINADGFSYLSPTTYPPATYCSKGGDVLRLNGFAASRGKITAPRVNGRPTVYISQRNLVSIDVETGKAFNAVSADRVIVKQGVVVKNLAALAPNPRTALGVNKNGRWLILMAVDGREFGVSEGATLTELANLLLSYGVYNGVNMDGGGSSAMVIRGVDGKPRTLNTAIDQNVPGRERAVANHLGVFIK